MKLLDLYINGFGKFRNRSIAFQNGIHVIYGKNEAGKSTLHTFIRGMLFGIEKNRGRAAKGDLYSKYEPWENKSTYGGRLRIEADGFVYRFERTFQKNHKEFTIVNETLGTEIEPTKAFLDQILDGLSETSYNNTISISQLKSATDSGMVSELKNYIANLNTSGNMALNITKAQTYLKNQRKALEAQTVAEAARNYTCLLSEIRNIEKEISSPEYANQLLVYQKMRNEAKSEIEEKQQEKETLIHKIARGKQILSSYAFTDQASITGYLTEAQGYYQRYKQEQNLCKNRTNRLTFLFSIIAATLMLGIAAFIYFLAVTQPPASQTSENNYLISGVLSSLAGLLYLTGAYRLFCKKQHQKYQNLASQSLTLILQKHLGDSSISQEAMNAFQERMAEFTRLSAVVTKSEAATRQLADDITDLQQRQNICGEIIEKQQRIQWELEHKLEQLTDLKDKADVLKYVLTENERLREEIASIDLALETMTTLSGSIQNSFGLYLNKTASELISGITGGIYKSMSIDENLNIFLNTKTKLVPIEQVSSGTMDQVYLALRLATAKLLQEGTERLPLIFDDSFSLYDDERLKTALVWLANAYKGQIIIFTCHQREDQVLKDNQIEHTTIII